MRNRFVIAVSCLLAVCIVASIARSQEKPDAKKQQNLAPSLEEMMAAWEKYAAPGKEHEAMKAMEGTFDAEVTLQMAPDQPANHSKGKIKNEMIFGGRYLRGDYSGTFMDKPFNGMSLLAFDRMNKEYVNTWIDDMSTMLMLSKGTGTPDGKTITLHMECKDPMTGKDKKMRTVLKIVSNDEHVMENFDLQPDGKEFKSMTIRYTRAR